jgi:glucose-6-phosphate 1-epimerase
MISHKKLDNDYEYIEIKNSQAEAKIALQGAHIFHYKAKDKPALLWLSKSSFFKEGKAIRGGIPICFPWFGPHKRDSSLPQHGFARTSLWKVVLEEELDENSTHIQLQLTSTNKSLKLWEYSFDIRLDVTVSSELTVTFTVINTDTKPFEISTALHTYFNISDISNVSVEGLDGSSYEDSLTEERKSQNGNLIIDKEVDRVYFNASSSIKLYDHNSSILLEQRGSNSLVVWNPWIEKAKSMVDMPDNGYKTMLCLETGNVAEDRKVLKSKDSHILEVIINSIF